MPEDDFNFFTPEEKESTAYDICIGSTTIIGAAVGGVGTGGDILGILVGAGAGYMYGKRACQYLKPEMSKKIFGSTERLTPLELSSGLKAIRMVEPTISKKEAMKIIAEVRTGLVKNPEIFLKILS